MDTIVTPVTVITLDSTRIVHSIKADLIARYFPPVVRLVQYDQSLPVIAVSLMQNGQTYTLPSGAAANIRVHKPDATYVYNPALGCDSTRNIVYFEVTQAMAAASGDGLAIVEIVVDGDIAGTSLITLHFEENPVPEDAIESSDEWETIYELGERIIASTVTPVSTAAGMTDHNVVYLYTGTESGWNQGHMYYYNGTTWVDAGIAVTDTTLSVAGLAADAKKTGDEIADLKDGLTAVESALPSVGIDFKNQSINSSGVISESSIRLLSPMFTAEVGEAFTLGSGYEFRLANINNDDSVTTDTWQTGTITISADRVTRYKAFYINVRNASNPNADISPSEITYNSTISYFGGYKKVASEYAVEQVEARVTAVESKFPSNYSLNHNYTGQGDMIWSWWYYPQVFSFKRVRDKLYWGFTTHDGYTGIAEYDYDTQTVTKNCLKKSDIDDHNGLALYVFDDGTIVCAYAGGHNTDSKMHIRISSTPESIERFEDDIPLDASGLTSYGQFVFYDGKLYLFYRVNNISWAYRYSADKGKTWSSETKLVVSTFQYYCKFMPTTTDGLVRICMYSNPGADDSNIRMGFINLSNGNIYNSDNSTILGQSNVSYSNFDIIIPNETGKTQRLLDVAITAPSRALILYAPFTLTSNTDSVYKIYDGGTISTLVNGGEALWHPKYQDGASWIGTSQIASIHGYMGQDIVEIYDYANNTATLAETVLAETKGSIPIRNARPIVDVNGKAFLWHRGYYDTNDYTKFNTDAKLHFLNQP